MHVHSDVTSYIYNAQDIVPLLLLVLVSPADHSAINFMCIDVSVLEFSTFIPALPFHGTVM